MNKQIQMSPNEKSKAQHLSLQESFSEFICVVLRSKISADSHLIGGTGFSDKRVISCSVMSNANTTRI